MPAKIHGRAGPTSAKCAGRLIGNRPGTDQTSRGRLLKLNVSGTFRSSPGAIRAGLQIGEWCLPHRSPFQLSATVTAGIVSRHGPKRMWVRRLRGFHTNGRGDQPGPTPGGGARQHQGRTGRHQHRHLQPEAAAIIARGIGFRPWPSNLARHVIDDLLKYGEVRRGFRSTSGSRA